MLIELNIIKSTSSTFVIISANDTTGIIWRQGLSNITTQNFVYNYNGGHRRTFEGHAGTDVASAGTDASARRALLEQLQPRYGVTEDTDPGVVISEQSTPADSVLEQPKAETLSPPTEVKISDQTVPEYARHNPRRSSRQRKPRQLYDAQ